jgi:hypothetical protein
MEKHTKLNVASLGLLVLSIIISCFITTVSDKPASDFNPFIFFLIMFYAPPVLLLTAFILSIMSVKKKRNTAAIVIMVAIIIAFVPVCYMQLFVLLCGISGYHG